MKSAEGLSDALKRAVSRKVDVHVIIDWLGTGPGVCRLLAAEFDESGIQYHVFNSWFKRGFVRLHRKLCVVDQRIAFVGGINILNDLRYDYNRKRMVAFTQVQDFAVRIAGSSSPGPVIYQEAIRLWTQTGKLSLKERLGRYRLLYLEKKNKECQNRSGRFDCS